MTKEKEAPKVYRASLGDFNQDTGNANQGTPRGGAMLEYSIREYGSGRSLLADSNNTLVAGNKTQRAGLEAGIKNVIVVETDGTELVVVKRTDLSLDKDPEARELAYMDNRVNEVSLIWNPDQVAADIAAELDLSMVFYDDELDKIIGASTAEEQTADEDNEAIPEMELHPFEHYDYIMLTFRDSFDWSKALDLFGLEKQQMTLSKSKSKNKNQRKQRKVGLVRAIDGRKVLKLCGSLSLAESE